MPQADATPARRRLLGPRNIAFLGAAVVTLVAGYVLLAGGQASAGAVLLVLGYCVLFPLGLAL